MNCCKLLINYHKRRLQGKLVIDLKSIYRDILNERFHLVNNTDFMFRAFEVITNKKTAFCLYLSVALSD